MSYWSDPPELPDDHVREVEPSDELLALAREQLGADANDDSVFELACAMTENDEREAYEDYRASLSEKD